MAKLNCPKTTATPVEYEKKNLKFGWEKQTPISVYIQILIVQIYKARNITLSPSI
jgi:hypothetical protein